MAWQKILATSDLLPGGREVVRVGKRNILVLNHDNQYYAVENSCPHLKVPMKSAKIENGTIVCSFHRSAFDLATGEVKTWCPWPPAVGKLMGMVSQQKNLPVFPLRVENDHVLIDIPE
ncbi:Rieske (2Fe-2S) protein [Cylindrospermopsis curvispora]|uniref:Rieske (2Fe-2S) protein n=1 Tax=Cylindrospermopsis curvispora GIHE-G1 TaxID=2666332 RepID=A0A7H0F256_9CYAN|nr:Rieske (2Fe-2S) protein [Cylindrospermopsis curvispora]QNP30122.1 Rieske (2Fe-2S) protein [Cylindrospermopsis curvispora GIHE-G1]